MQDWPKSLGGGKSPTVSQDGYFRTNWLQRTSGEGTSAGSTIPKPAQNDLSEIEVAMRGLHLSKSWMNHPRRVSPFFGRTPLELMIAEDGEGFGQVIEFLAELTFNRRIH